MVVEDLVAKEEGLVKKKMDLMKMKTLDFVGSKVEV